MAFYQDLTKFSDADLILELEEGRITILGRYDRAKLNKRNLKIETTNEYLDYENSNPSKYSSKIWGAGGKNLDQLRQDIYARQIVESNFNVAFSDFPFLEQPIWQFEAWIKEPAKELYGCNGKVISTTRHGYLWGNSGFVFSKSELFEAVCYPRILGDSWLFAR